MIERPFVGLKKHRLKYASIEARPPEPKKIPLPNKVTLILESPFDERDPVFLEPGDKVKTGQRVSLSKKSEEYVISSVTGKVSSLSPYTGEFGQPYSAISIDVAEDEEIDNQFAEMCNHPTLEGAREFLASAPGKPSFKAFSDSIKSIDTIVVCGTDRDPLITTSQYIIKLKIAAMKSGISTLRKITDVDRIIMTVPAGLTNGHGDIGAELKTVKMEYPAALPHSVMKDILDRVVPAGKSFEDAGVCFFSAEAVASIGHAFHGGQIPVTKTLTLIKKDGSKAYVEARIGIPISDILRTFDVTLREKDRIIIGGPMTGSSVPSEDYPVQPDTDAIIVQDSENVALVSDYPCTNCGECVRVCPAKIPVNLLVRLLEAEEYEEAADRCDLHSCIECGLCSFVCISRMPIFQYIRLAKYELARTKAAEGTHG